MYESLVHVDCLGGKPDTVLKTGGVLDIFMYLRKLIALEIDLDLTYGSQRPLFLQLLILLHVTGDYLRLYRTIERI